MAAVEEDGADDCLLMNDLEVLLPKTQVRVQRDS